MKYNSYRGFDHQSKTRTYNIRNIIKRLETFFHITSITDLIILFLGFHADDLSRTHEGYPTSETDQPRLQPHCSFGPAEALFASFRTEGRVTTACLWHACRVVTLGFILVIMGITFAIVGKKNYICYSLLNDIIL